MQRVIASLKNGKRVWGVGAQREIRFFISDFSFPLFLLDK
jgi:hypothetical protein